MRLKVEHVARVKHAEIELSGVTVIAGYNGTGKSTISKSLYALTDALSGLPEKVRMERCRSLARSLFTWEPSVRGSSYREREMEDCRRAAKRLVEESQPLTEQSFYRLLSEEFPTESPSSDTGEYEKICSILRRDASEYERFIAERAFRSAFRNQINSLHTSDPAVFSLEQEENIAQLSFKGNELMDFVHASFSGMPAVYIGTLNVLDVIAQEPENVTCIDRLEELLFRERQEEKLTYEEYRRNRENAEAVREILKAITEGHIVREGKRLHFLADQYSEAIDFSNLASGLKTFVIIQTLIDNGSLGAGSILIVDEPEVNLHPEWQLKFAEILVLLHERLGITMLLNTHSPYFLRAIEIYLAEYGTAEHGRYYFTEEQETGFSCTDVTKNPEIIYRALYNPLEQL